MKKKIWRVYKVPARTKEKMHSRFFSNFHRDPEVYLPEG